MVRIVIKMLFGERVKVLGLVFGVAFATLLVAQQAGLFVGLMTRSQNVIADAPDVDIWVMDPAVEYVDLIRPMRDTELYRVRGVAGVAWAVPLAVVMTVVLTVLEVLCCTALGLAASAVTRRGTTAAISAILIRFTPVILFAGMTRYEVGGFSWRWWRCFLAFGGLLAALLLESLW